jgi:hypothetical protein
VERAAIDRIERQIDREVKARFPDGAVQRVALLQCGDDPAIEPEELLVRVFIEAAGGPQDSQRPLDAWRHAHEPRMRQLRREASSRCGFPRPDCWNSPSTALAIPLPRPGSRCPTTPG